MLIQRHGSVAESDGIAETGLPFDCFLGEVHDNLGPLGVWMKEQWVDGRRPANAAALDRQAPLGFVVASMRRGRERATQGV